MFVESLTGCAGVRVLSVWCMLRGTGVGGVAWVGGSWIIANGTSFGVTFMLAWLTGQRATHFFVTTMLVRNALVIILAGVWIARNRDGHTEKRQRKWHVAVRLGALYLVAANLFAGALAY